MRSTKPRARDRWIAIAFCFNRDTPLYFLLRTCCSSGNVPERTALQLGGQDRPALNAAVLSGMRPNSRCSVCSLANPMNVYIYGHSFTEPCTSYAAQIAAPAVHKVARIDHNCAALLGAASRLDLMPFSRSVTSSSSLQVTISSIRVTSRIRQLTCLSQHQSSHPSQVPPSLHS